jgi:mannosyl-oligosaccharide alpha-1,2-mannosidase
MAPTYISKVPRKWRLITLIVFLLFIFVQTWNIKNTSAPPTTASIKPETEKKKSYQNGDGIKLAPPRKQSLLNGFGGFLSSLPQMQHDFEPEPLEYTKLREERRLAVKEAFLHGWNGYSKSLSQLDS